MPTPADPGPDSPSSTRRDFVDVLTDAWGRERPELDTSRLGFEARILRLSRRLEALAVGHVGELGLTNGELNVLAALRRAGEPFRLTPTELTRSLLLSSGAMTNRIDRLEERDLVTRVPSTTDRRKVLIELTPHGRATIDTAMDRHTAGLARDLAALDDDEVAHLTSLLARVLHCLERSDD